MDKQSLECLLFQINLQNMGYILVKKKIIREIKELILRVLICPIIEIGNIDHLIINSDTESTIVS